MAYNQSFTMFSLLFLIVFFMIIGLFIYSIVRGIMQWNRNNNSPRLSVNACISSNRVDVSYHHHNNAGDATGMHGTNTTSSTDYYVTFQVDSGDRIELYVNGHEYGMLAEGDQGVLTFQGTRYLGFERNF